MNFLKKLFGEKQKPQFVTFGGQEIWDLFDDEVVELIIEKESKLAEVKKLERLHRLDVNEKDVEECMAFIFHTNGLGLSGTIRGLKIVISLVLGGYSLTINGKVIEDNVPNKMRIINFIHEVRRIVDNAKQSVTQIRNVVHNAKTKQATDEEYKSKIESGTETINTFFRKSY